MQLKDIVKDFADMSDEELHARLTEIRNNRLRAPEKVQQAERKKTKTAKTGASKLLEGMSKDDIQKLLAKYT